VDCIAQRNDLSWILGYTDVHPNATPVALTMHADDDITVDESAYSFVENNQSSEAATLTAHPSNAARDVTRDTLSLYQSMTIMVDSLGRQDAYSHAQEIELHTSCEQVHLSILGLGQYHDFETEFAFSHEALCIHLQHLGTDDHPDQHLKVFQVLESFGIRSDCCLVTRDKLYHRMIHWIDWLVKRDKLQWMFPCLTKLSATHDDANNDDTTVTSSSKTESEIRPPESDDASWPDSEKSPAFSDRLDQLCLRSIDIIIRHHDKTSAALWISTLFYSHDLNDLQISPLTMMDKPLFCSRDLEISPDDLQAVPNSTLTMMDKPLLCSHDLEQEGGCRY
jgi:hypothetical protein